jgi:catechol-2,3-dioxygenase
MGISLWIDWKNTCSSSLGSQGFDPFVSIGMVFHHITTGIWVNAWYIGSKATKNTLPISPYKIFFNDSNRHGCYLKKY